MQLMEHVCKSRVKKDNSSFFDLLTITLLRSTLEVRSNIRSEVDLKVFPYHLHKVRRWRGVCAYLVKGPPTNHKVAKRLSMQRQR